MNEKVIEEIARLQALNFGTWAVATLIIVVIAAVVAKIGFKEIKEIKEIKGGRLL